MCDIAFKISVIVATHVNDILFTDDQVIMEDTEGKFPQLTVYQLYQLSYMNISLSRTKTIAFYGKYPIRTKLHQQYHFGTEFTFSLLRL